jgi:hypothetical protein
MRPKENNHMNREVTITVPSADDPEVREILDWNASSEEIWDRIKDMSPRKMCEFYASVRRVSTKAVTRYIIRDWMENIGVGHLATAMDKAKNC